MALNFNVAPYYDDFDPTKNFHRILFKPGFAVQGRELTQAQSILQDQVTKFADNIFKQNSPVTGGQVTTNFNCHYVKLQETYNDAAIDINDFIGLLVQDATGLIVARVLQVVASTGEGGDPPTLILSYLSGNQFTNGSVIYDTASNLACVATVTDATGQSSVASIEQGVFYVLGNFVQIAPSTVVLSKYSNLPSVRVGITYSETIQDYIDEPSLLDPAIGASNYQAPGADRYVISLTLSTRPLQFGDDSDFIELTRITNGEVAKIVDGSVYNVIDDYFAKRDYETNGDYVVNDFRLTPKTNVDTSKYTLSVGKGIAYVHGYRIESQTPIELVSNRARTTETQNNNPVFTDYGSYFYVDNVRGANTGYFDVTTPQTIDLHCVSSANVNITSNTTYNSTVVASGFIRGLVFDYSTNNAQSNTFVYKAYVHDLQNSVLTANAASGTSSTITFPSTFSSSNSAYVGVNISITGGTSAGDFRTITAYNGSTKTATVNQNWTVTPTTSSVFALNFDVKDVETMMYVVKSAGAASIRAKASINNRSKLGNISTGDTVLDNPNLPELLFPVGSPYVSNITDSSYTTQQVTRNLAFTVSGGSVTAQLNYQGSYLDIIRHLGAPSSTLSIDAVEQNYTIIVTDKGSNTLIDVGDIVPWTTAGRTITLNNDSSVATLAATDLSPFTATIIEKVFVVNADTPSNILKYKNLIQANTNTINSSNTQVATYTFVDNNTLTSTGQVYIQNSGLVAPGQKQSLYLSDVKGIIKIIDTKSPSTVPTVAMISNPTYDVSSSYLFDNGQRDNYYDHASLTLRPGAVQPKGNILIFLDYYQHSGGDGYFSIESYTSSTLPEDYQEIATYVSRNGSTYSLRDCLDFRPARLNATTTFDYRYSQPVDSRRGIFLPVDLSIYTCDYSFYLGRRDKLVLSKDRSFEIIEGAPSLVPLFPTEPDGSLVIAQMSHTPYTGYIPTEAPNGFVPDLSIQKVKHKRYTMQDIAGLETRINNVEYYTSLSLLEQNAQTLQISDVLGLNRFKNGIVVDDFSSFATSDTLNIDFAASINRRERRMSASHEVNNYPLKSLALAYNMGRLYGDANTLGYAINSDGYTNYFSLPYTTTEVISQKLASRTVNVNPFSFSITEGVVALSPNIDNWVDTSYAPALLIIDNDLQVFRANSQSLNVLTAGDWQTMSGTSVSSSRQVEGHNINASPFGFIGFEETSTTTTLTQRRTDIIGAYDKVSNTYAFENNYITDISVLPFIRKQQVVIRSAGMLINTNVNTWFDLTDVKNYVRKANIIELTGVTGTFREDDVIGYYVSGVFTPTGRILGVYDYPNNNNIRLYVAADGRTTTYTPSGTIQNALFNSAGVYQSSTASGTVASTKHYGGVVRNIDLANNKVVLASTASATNGFYTGNTIYICAGTGAGRSATISNYYAANQTAVLSSSIVTANNDLYSIGTFNTDESGSFYGVFNLPENTFHTGQRVFRVDNSTGGNIDSATTYSEGTFYAQGLQAKAQSINFGASPAGAKNTFTQTSQRTITNTATTISPWDPVAQAFIITKDTYPNGIFIKSAKFFFASKPTSDNSPITLSIVGTQNGYPNGETLDQSIVSLTPQQIVVSQTPQFSDSTTYTTFEFSVPIYIQPGTLYSFILKSNSREYTLWSALNGDTALTSSVKNLPTDPDPSTTTKIGSAPYVGALFLSQNAQTWTAEQNQALMFVVDRCVFNISATPNIQYVVPTKLPQRTLVEQSCDYFINANTISTSTDSISTSNVYVDAFNMTTTDFTPTSTNIGYSYNATLVNGSAAGSVSIIPGKFGTATPDNIFLNDGKGQRVLFSNSSTSLSVYASLFSSDPTVSPIVSDAGLSAYTIKWNINNCELSNGIINIVNSGSGYNVNTTTVSVSAPTGTDGTQAYAVANVVGGLIDAVYITTPGSGYITTPTITITDANTTPGTGASVTVSGETSSKGGPALAKYITKKVALDAGFDSGDINVYLTAYRPVNTDINVYYKILGRNDTQKFEDASWQLMTKIKNSESLYSPTRDNLYEYVFAPGTDGTAQNYVSYTSTNGQTYTTFSQMAIKVVLTSTDHTFTPFATDLRVLALPADVNTTV